jgi:restriction endonuclease Mrr
MGQSKQSLQQAMKRFGALAGFIGKIGHAPTQKGIQDLQARIGSEQTLLKNEGLKQSMLKGKHHATTAVHRQKMRQIAIKSAGGWHKVHW